MRAHAAIVVAVAIAAIFACVGCVSRANPRLIDVVTILDRDTTDTSIAYDASGHPSTITQRVTGGGTTDTHTAQLAYFDSHLTSWTLDGSRETFQYDGDLVTAMHVDHDGDGTSDVAIAYDGGRVASATRTDVNAAGVDVATTTTTFSYGARGLATVSVEQEVPGQSATQVSTALFYDRNDDRIASFVRTARDEDTITARYDAKHRLAELTATVSIDALPGFPETFRYGDDGNIAEIDGQDVKVTFAYEDGDAADFDVNPVHALLPTAAVAGRIPLPLSFWTLDGASSPVPDARTQAVHLFGALGPTW